MDDIKFIPDEDLVVHKVDFVQLSQTQNWGVDVCKINEAWKVSRGKGVKVAVLDTGITPHIDLEGQWNQAFNCTSDPDYTDGSSHGCIAPNDKIFINGQGITTIKDFYVQTMPDSVFIDGKDGFTIKTTEKQNLEVLSFNDGKFEMNKIKAIHQLDYIGEIYKVQTNSSEISLTPWHPVYIKDGKSYKKVRAEELKVGDNLYSVIPTEISSDNLKLFYGKYSKCNKCEYLTRGSYRKYCRKCNAKDSYETIEKYIELDENLAFLAGLIISDGHVMKLDNSIEFCGNDINLINICFDLFEKIFDITPRRLTEKNRTSHRIRANGVELKKFFIEQLGIPQGSKSLTVTLPEVFKKCSDSIFSAFIAGVIEGDGNVDKKDWRIRICSGSVNFVNELKENLRFRGIKSHINSFSQKWTDNLGYHIGFSATPLIAKHLRIKRSERYLPTARVFDKIQNITVELYSGQLYDLTVENTANYIANGFVVSNTHVAGIIAATDNDQGVVGIAPESFIIPIKVLTNNGSGSYDFIAKGLRTAIDAGADIINMSLGASVQPPQMIHDLIKEAVSRGIIIIAAAGNDAKEVNWPARYEEVIAVAALDEKGAMAHFSSRGEQVKTVAPGVQIFSTVPTNQYGMMSGTSQASPFVAGVCALILSHSRNTPGAKPIIDYVDMLRALDTLCDNTPYLQTGDAKNWGFGIPKFANINWSSI